MGAVVTEKKAGEVVSYSPKEGAAKIHLTDAAVKAAERAKDASAFETAIRKNLEAKYDFAAHYKSVYQGVSNQHAGASTGASAEEYCEGFGFALRTVQRWCEKLLPEGGLEMALKERMKAARKRFVDDVEAANYSSEDVEWYTPEVYIKSVTEVLGGIDLDPASSPLANETVKAAQIFTAEEDGLSQPWHGRVFMNPPYGTREMRDETGKTRKQSVAALFCNKLIEEYIAGNVDCAILLVNSAHAQKWQAPLYDYPVCFVDHRIPFINAEGQVNKSPTFMNIFVYLGPDKQKFAETFEEHGYVMERVR